MMLQPDHDSHTAAAAPRKLSPEELQHIRGQLEGICQHLPQEGASALIERLFGHVAALEQDREMLSQYYEEFVIPDLQGRPIGRCSAGADVWRSARLPKRSS